MQEDIIFRRRNRLKKHFVNTSNVLLYCYAFVSDAAKITYQIIDGFDWEDKETGESKGYVFPAVETIAKIRHTSTRTIQRHILELIKAKLLTRIRQRNKPSILYIEDVSDEEINKYFQYFESKDRKISVEQVDTSTQTRNDIFVVSHEASETTKVSFAYKEEENEKKENKNNVNEHETKEAKKRGNGIASLADISKQYDIEKFRSAKKPDKQRTADERMKRDYYAQTMAQELNDTKSLGAFRIIAEHVPESVIFQALANVRETARDGKIKHSRGALFMTIIQQWCEAHGKDLGFKPRASVS